MPLELSDVSSLLFNCHKHYEILEEVYWTQTILYNFSAEHFSIR
jgi:hypothetical protein